MLEKKEVNKRNRKKTKWTFQYEGFFFCSKKLKNTKLEMRKETKKRKEREDTKQYEPGGKWNKKNMCSKNKNKRKEKNTKRTK